MFLTKLQKDTLKAFTVTKELHYNQCEVCTLEKITIKRSGLIFNKFATKINLNANKNNLNKYCACS